MTNKITCEKSKWEMIKDSLRNHFLFKFITKFSESGSKNKMAIICDICKIDVTPNEDTEINEYSVLKFHGDRICLCVDCECAIYEWLKSEDCKNKCLEFKKQFETERE